MLIRKISIITIIQQTVNLISTVKELIINNPLNNQKNIVRMTIHSKKKYLHKNSSYPQPIVEHKKEAEIAKHIFQKFANAD